ncbi:MAG: DAK2 domain-containing protein [Candidatus Nanopelagicales bacterium]|jgi:DAK2 domain fusion protein YloV
MASSRPSPEARHHRSPRAAPLHAAAIRAWAEASLAAIGQERAAIDALNVFPVPDGDTGTNMFLTVESACAAIEEVFDAAEAAAARPTVSDVSAAMARGAMLGARGNSGVILAQIIRGVSGVLDAEGSAGLTGAVVAHALRAASDNAYAAVSRPVEGTILTVARAAADASEAAVDEGSDLVEVIESAVAAAHEALALTIEQLPALRDAGVVDAGGQGLVVVYDALLDVVTGVRRSRPGVTARTKLPAPHGVHGAPIALEGEPSYEVMYLITASAAQMTTLRSALESMGDSLMVTGDDTLWNVHVHVHDAGAAIEAGLAVGPLERIRVTYLAAATAPTAGRGLVVVTHGPGTATLVTEQGAVAVAARPRRRPSTAELLEGMRATYAAEVVVLPSDSDSLAVAEAAAEQARGEGLRVSVIPARSIVQSLAALAVHDPSARFDDDVIAMTRAVAATRYAAVTIASRAALTSAGSCREGDVLGLADGDIVEIGTDILEVSAALADRLLSSGGELVSVVRGCDLTQAEVDDLDDRVQRGHPGVDVVVIDGGQPLWPVIIGVE